MGERGPLPKANARRRNKRNGVGVKRAIIKRPAAPKTLAGEARAEWNRIVPKLEEMGLLTTVDRAVLIRYCRSWADWCELDTKLVATGVLVKGRRDALVRNPLWLLRSDAEATLSDLGRQLGLTPAARVRAGVEHVRDLPPPKEPELTAPSPDDFDPRRLLRVVNE